MLLPEDYGVIAMMSIFIAISTSLIDSGMAQALIQRPQRSQSDLCTALIFNISVAVVVYAIIYMCAPLISQFYGVEELVAVARVYSLVLIINSFSVVQQALIAIDLDFKRQAQASLTGVLTGGVVAIYAAYNGYGVWALVAQQIISSIVTTTLLWVMSSWRATVNFSWESFHTLSRFGSKVMLSGLLHMLYTNLYTVIIGRWFAPATLGLYNRATTISALPSSNISTIVDRALYPILCREQEDVDAASEALLRHLGMVCFVVFPVMVGISVMSEPLTDLLLGQRWGSVAPLLQAVALANMWDPVMRFLGSIIRSQGRSGDYLRAETIKKICGVGILIATLPMGVEAMCWGLVAYAAADMTIIIFFSRKISLRLGYAELLRRGFPTIISCALMGVAVWLLSTQLGGLNSALQLLVSFAVGAGCYICLSLVLQRERLREILNIIKF